jgi:hypothetical protein
MSCLRLILINATDSRSCVNSCVSKKCAWNFTKPFGISSRRSRG